MLYTGNEHNIYANYNLIKYDLCMIIQMGCGWPYRRNMVESLLKLRYSGFKVCALNQN